ncbi:MAG: cytochrome c oxidase subunit II [Gaiellaceae bacterium]
MRWKLPSLVFALVVVLATAGVATAANGGFTPVTPASPNASHTQTAYYVILGLTSAIFVLVEGLLVLFVVKYRGRGRARTVEGAQVHGHTRLELTWTVLPVVMLGAIATVVFLELPKITPAPAAADPIHITVEGHQFYWQFDYPNRARSIGTLYVPTGAVVDLKVVSPDVIHSWWIPALAGKIQAIPGHPNHIWFSADKPGSYRGQCAELCGVYHASMTATVVAESRSQYDAYINNTAATTLGRQEFAGVCATCHGNLGQGGYGPNIANNSIIIQPTALEGIVRNGFTGSLGAMPPVADTWNGAQINALVKYLKKHIYKAAPLGG